MNRNSFSFSGQKTQKSVAFLIVFIFGLLSIIASNGGGGGGGDSDEPGTLAFSASNYSVAEDGSGSATITVTRTGGSTGTVTVNYAASDGTAAVGSDYTAPAGTTLTWTDGDTADKTFVIPIINDTDVELPQTVLLALSYITGGATLGRSSATLTITSEDQFGTIRFSNASYSVNETDGTVTDVITLERVNGSSGSVSVEVSVSGGSATGGGTDYTFTSPTIVNWGDGVTADQNVSITLVDDAINEGSLTVDLTLGNAGGGASIGTPSDATVYIADDEAPASPGVLQLDSATYSVDEDAGTVTITVNRLNGTSGAASVNYATSDDTATIADGDYTGTSGTLNWGAGVGGAQTFTVDITNDAEVEAEEEFNVTLSTFTGAAEGSQSTASVTINIDDTNLTMNIGDGTYWVAFQDGPSGTWTEWSPTIGYTYDFPVTDSSGRYGVAFHVQETDSILTVEKTYVIHATVSELPDLDAFNEPKYSVSGTLSNYTTGSHDSAAVAMHLIGDQDDGFDPYAYTIPLVSAGARDLLAIEMDIDEAVSDNIVVRRNINVASDLTNQDVNFDTDSDVEAVTGTPHNFNGSIAGQQLDVYFATDNGTSINMLSEIYNGTDPAEYYYVTNSSMRQSGDVYSFQLTHQLGTRFKVRNKDATIDPGDQSLGFGFLTALTGTSVSTNQTTGLSYTPDANAFGGSTPVFRGFNIDLDQTVVSIDGGAHWQFKITDGWLGGSTSYTHPDLASISGYDSAWELNTGSTTNATVTAVTTDSNTGDSYITRKSIGRNSTNLIEWVVQKKLAHKNNAKVDAAMQFSSFSW